MADLLLVHDFPPMGGGIARWMGEFAKRANLVTSTGAMPDANDGDFPGGVDRLWISTSRLKTVAGLLIWRSRVKTLVRRHRPGFIWAGNIRPTGRVAARTSHIDQVPFGLMVHGGDLLRFGEKYRRPRSRRSQARGILSTAAVIVANSRWTAALAAEVGGQFEVVFGDRLQVVPLGSDPVRFHPGSPQDAATRFGLPPGRTWLVTVARLVPHKGIDRGIEVVSRLRHLYPSGATSSPDRGPILAGCKIWRPGRASLTEFTFARTSPTGTSRPSIGSRRCISA